MYFDVLWIIRGQTDGVHPKLLDLNPAVKLLMHFESRWQSCLKMDWFAGNGVVEF